MSLEQLEAGHEFGPYDLNISARDAADYASAVGGDESPSYDGAMPPMALIAAGLSKIINELGIVDGSTQTVHAGQEVEFMRPVEPGEPIEARGVLKSNSLRRGNRFATVQTEFVDAAGETVATSSSTIIVTQ